MADTKPITWVELAKRLGYSRAAVYLWREMEGAPDTTDLVQWQAFVEQHGLGNAQTKSLTELKAAVEAEKLRKLRRENEVAEGRIVPVDTMLEINGEIAARVALLLKTKFVVEMPPLCVGLPIAEIRAIARGMVDEICDVTTRGILDWKPDD